MPSEGPTDGDRQVAVFAVVVLYRTLPADSTTVRTLLRAAAYAAGSGLRLAIALHDNSPGAQQPPELPPEVRYTADPANSGLSTAYNHAATIATAEGFDWLLTLDQDTALPEDFLAAMTAHAQRFRHDPRVAAVAPHIVDGGRHISPLQFFAGFLPQQLPADFSGLAPRHSSAINSGTLLRLSALAQVGGYDLRFPLNNSDSSLFFRLDAAGFRLAVAGEVRVQHELAIMNRQDRMSLERYGSLLADERACWDLHMGVLGRTERGARLALRVVKDLLQGRNQAFRTPTLRELRLRLLTRHRTRLERWRESR